MKSVSHAVLAAALAVGIVATPAVAQRGKKEEAAAPKMNFSKEFRAAAAPVQKALSATPKDFATAAAGLATMDAAATTPDDKYTAGQFRYNVAIGTKNDADATRAVTMMLNSGVAPADQVPALKYHLGREAYFAKRYPDAVRLLTESFAAGNKSTDAYIIAADANFKQKMYPQGLVFVDQGIAAMKASGQKVPEDWYQRALSGAYSGKQSGDLVKWSSELVRNYPTQENWRSALVLYRDSKTLDPQATLDLYRLMRVTKSIAGERDYFDYAALASERGLSGETKSVTEEAFASGKVPAASRPLGELRTLASGKSAADLASLPGSATAANAAATGKRAMSTGDAYLGHGQYAKAAELYRVAIAKGGDIEPNVANTRLGIALSRSGDKEGARAAFAKVTGPRAEIASYWMLYLDMPPTA